MQLSQESEPESDYRMYSRSRLIRIQNYENRRHFSNFQYFVIILVYLIENDI